MAKSDHGFDPTAYAPVAERIRLFWGSFPNGRITTRLVSRTEHDVVFEARVYRSANESEPAATGWAAEREGDGDVNAVACLENTETSAVGRALANLGFTAAKERPSAEEMQKAARARARLTRGRVAEPLPTPVPTPIPIRATVRASRVTAVDVLEPRRISANGRQDARQEDPRQEDPRQSYANLVADLLRLIDRATQHGLRTERARRWSEALLSRQFAPALLAVCERRLRAWLARRVN
jgi:hypothetical protein